MDANLSALLKPALKTPKRVSIMDSHEPSSLKLGHTFIPPSPMLKPNYIKPTRASQILFIKNNALLSPGLQVELNTNRYELGRLPHIGRKKKFDYKKATESLTPIKENPRQSGKVAGTAKSHISNINRETGVKTKKLEPLASQILINLTEQNAFDDFSLEKYINMINIDQEVFYLGCSFLSVFLESLANSLPADKKGNASRLNNLSRSVESQSITNRSSHSLNVRFSNHYSNKNLTNLSKLSLDSLITTSNTQRSVNTNINNSNNTVLTKKGLMSLNSDSRLTMNSDFEEKATVKSSLFGINFPVLRLEQFKEYIMTLKYPNSKYHFQRILMRSNLKVEMDIGFIEFEVSEKKFIEVHKLYIIKVYRKMEIYESILENLFKNLFDSTFAKSSSKIFMKVLDRFESYKATLGRLGFLLNQKMKIKEEYIAYMVLKRKD